MHVALIHTDLRAYWPPRIAALGKALQRGNHTLSVIEIAGRGSPYDFARSGRGYDEFNWHVLFPEGDLRHMSPRLMARSAEQKLDELRPDVVMAGAIAFPSGAAAVRWARRNHRGVIIFDNARSEDVPRSWVVESAKRRVYANVDAVLIPAESHVPSYAHWGISRERMYFGLNVVDNCFFRTRADVFRPHAEEFRRNRGLPERFFLGVGRHIRQKNWSGCLSAYVAYRDCVTENAWGLVLVGDGPDHDSLDTMVSERGIPDVHLPGTVCGEDLMQYYVSANALVLPSYGETWGLVVNEAMACSLPVLVSDQCGCAETLVQNGVNGWTFSPGSPEELAKRMLQMSSLFDEEYSKMACASEEIIRSWGLDRFVEGAVAAIDTCREVNRGFTSPLDRLLISRWNGRFRPT